MKTLIATLIMSTLSLNVMAIENLRSPTRKLT